MNAINLQTDTHLSQKTTLALSYTDILSIYLFIAHVTWTNNLN